MVFGVEFGLAPQPDTARMAVERTELATDETHGVSALRTRDYVFVSVIMPLWWWVVVFSVAL
jgi:hypothetical protein